MRAASPENEGQTPISRRDRTGRAKWGSDPLFRPAESSPIGSGGRAREIASWLLLVAGLVAIGGGIAIHAKAGIGQALLDVAWKRARTTGIAPAPWPGADTRPVARIVAPAQGAEALVLAGASGRTLAWGPGHLDGTAMPGERGNAVVAAHRDTHFRFLARARAGDPIVVERLDGVRVAYRIVETRVADASRLAIPRDADVPTLTMVTCWPFDAIAPGGPLRYVVVARAETPIADARKTAAAGASTPATAARL
jgi:sortase A